MTQKKIVLEEGQNRQNFLDSIRNFYNNVNGYDMRAKARKIEHLLIAIFEREDSHPEQKLHTERLLRTYLPVITKSLDRLLIIQKENVEGESELEMRKTITELLNSSTTALTEIRDKMYADELTDISLDVKVMQTLMKQEGLLNEEEKTVIASSNLK